MQLGFYLKLKTENWKIHMYSSSPIFEPYSTFSRSILSLTNLCFLHTDLLFFMPKKDFAMDLLNFYQNPNLCFCDGFCLYHFILNLAVHLNFGCAYRNHQWGRGSCFCLEHFECFSICYKNDLCIKEPTFVLLRHLHSLGTE